MKILFIGDIVGEDALEYLKTNLTQIKKDNNINLVFANAENLTKGRGLSHKHYLELMKLGVSAISMGNHTFDNLEILEYMNESNLIRPANFDTKYGKGYITINYNGKKVTLINLLGRVNMNNLTIDCPFKTLDNILDNVQSDYFIVDFHAEATSEKRALAFDFDGKVSAIVGTHTHVPTADEQVLPNNTLYITDVGMTGPKDSIIGMELYPVISKYRSGVHRPFKVKGDSGINFNAVILEINDNLKNKIKRINL